MTEILWELIPWGYQVLLQIERWRTDLLDAVFPIITDIGGEIGYIIIFSLVYWCVSKSIGKRLSYAYLLTATFNSWLKHIWRIPRPDSPALEPELQKADVTARLQPIRHETSPSFPSGHTQGAVVAWGYMAVRFARRWFWVVAVTMIGLIAFSRMYLGVHFPQDVMAGLVIGLLYVALWLWAEPHLQQWIATLSVRQRVALTGLVPLGVLLIHPVENTATALGALSGLGVGYVLESETLRFTVAGPLWQRVARAIVGLLLLGLAYVGLSTLFGLFDEQMGEIMAIVWRTLRYALLGFMGSWIVPWAQMRVGLLEREETSAIDMSGGQ